MGNFFKGSTTTTKQPFETNPWNAQQPYLTTGFSQGKDALNTAMAGVAGVQDPVANMNAGQTDAINGMTDLGMNGAQNFGNAALNLGMTGMQNFGDYSANNKSIYDFASKDATDAILANGEKYANNPFLQGQIDSALGDVNRAFQKDQASINSGASGTGNINSTRAGALEAIAQNDAMNRGAAISSQMRGDAYLNGVNQAAQEYQSRFGNMSAANQAMGAGSSIGADLANSGINAGMTGFNSALDSQGRLQNQAQNEIDGGLNLSGMPLDLVSKYMSAVGGNYGSSGYTTNVQKNPSIFQSLIGGAASLAGAGFKLPFMG